MKYKKGYKFNKIIEIIKVIKVVDTGYPPYLCSDYEWRTEKEINQYKSCEKVSDSAKKQKAYIDSKFEEIMKGNADGLICGLPCDLSDPKAVVVFSYINGKYDWS